MRQLMKSKDSTIQKHLLINKNLTHILIIIVMIYIVFFTSFFLDKIIPGDLTLSLFFYNYDFGFSKRALIGSLLKYYSPDKNFSVQTLTSIFSLLHFLCGVLFLILFRQALFSITQ